MFLFSTQSRDSFAEEFRVYIKLFNASLMYAPRTASSAPEPRPGHSTYTQSCSSKHNKQNFERKISIMDLLLLVWCGVVRWRRACSPPPASLVRHSIFSWVNTLASESERTSALFVCYNYTQQHTHTQTRTHSGFSNIYAAWWQQ